MNKALIELKDMRAKLKSYEQAKNEPIAIIGIGCRFPGGADNPNAFWQLLRDGVDAIREVPADRWDIDAYYSPDLDAPGKMYTRYGGFVEHVDQFDSHFFGISPREALSLDPQQRLLLEVSWEALENAALVPSRLMGSQTGVFMGICGNDYLNVLFKNKPADIDAYLSSGNAHSMASGRLSYFLGLQGPNLAVDTACSSSLVAVHLAVMSLRNRESNLALAGGVNRILSPEFSIHFCRSRMLSPDGRCKTFDLSANGSVIGEGCGVVVLKRMQDALADGDRIWGLIRGSAINQDGRTSGLTVPNGPQQIAVIKQALSNAGVAPQEISYVEAHGTGSSLGDPIEVGALGSVFKMRQPEEPLMIGSVKTNFGNLQGASGIAGLIKVVLALHHEEIPPHLHFSTPNPYINWDELPVTVPTERTPWPRGERKRLAGVSAFGFNGTNAHLVLSEAPIGCPLGASHSESFARGISSSKGHNERPYHLLVLSAKTEKALTELATRYENHLTTQPHLELADVCFTATSGRSHFNHRLAVVGQSKAEIQEKLAGARVDGVFKGQVQEGVPPKVAFLFTGEGSQYVGMGRQLYETQPTFRLALDRCDEILRPYLSHSLLSVLYPSPSSAHDSPFTIDKTASTQPALFVLLFALEYALFELWKSWGITPNVVMGHGLGEYVAACVAGVFSLSDGLKLIAAHAQLMHALPSQNWAGRRGDGEMVAVMANEAQVQAAIATYSSQVSIAAINGPQNVVISGKSETVQAIVLILEASGIKTRQLTLSHAFHSPLITPILDDFYQVARQINYSEPKLDFISNVTGQLVTNAKEWHDKITMPDYWVRHLREPVRFADGIATCHRLSGDVFIEIGPQATLLDMARDCLPNERPLCLPSLRQGQSDWQQMLQSLGQLYVRGVPVDWAGFERDYVKHRRRVVLPTYPWQRKRYWVETSHNGAAVGQVHPLGNGQQKADSFPNQGQTPIVTLLHQGDSKQLSRLLAKAANFSPDEGKLLPKLLEVLVEQHQQQLKEANSQQVIRRQSPSLSPVRFLRKVLNRQVRGDSAELISGSSQSRQQLESHLFWEQFTEARPKERPNLLQTYIQAQAGQVLGLEPYDVDVQQPLSQLGLDSLMSTELRTRLQKALDINVPVASFFQNPTVAQLTTQLLAQQALVPSSSTSYSPLVPIQPTGSKPPFFCVHPWVGLVYPYYDLANELGSDQPFSGLQSVGMYGQPDRTIEEMATHYIEALRSVSKGPYLLGGWSFGGLVAFEMAQQLHRAGEEVALLALLDTPAPLNDKRLSLLLFFKFLLSMSSRYIWPYIYDYLAIVADQTKDVVSSGSAASSNGSRLRLAFSKRFAMAKTVLREARSLTKSQSTARRMVSSLNNKGPSNLNYVAQPYPGRVPLFRVWSQLVSDDQEQTLGWNKLAAGGVTVQMVPGHHLNLLRKPHVQLLAAELEASINQI
jgi:acyl transferase domain-containing protein/thioesterase domain-containing protein